MERVLAEARAPAGAFEGSLTPRFGGGGDGALQVLEKKPLRSVPRCLSAALQRDLLDVFCWSWKLL